MKQKVLFDQDITEDIKKQKYSTKVEAPVYYPKNKQPHILELYDYSKTNIIIYEIKNSQVTEEEKKFLIEAAKRHTVFNYEKIADYYAHASSEMQRLMERSGLVIIDFENAIQYGFVRLCDDIHKQYLEEYGE